MPPLINHVSADAMDYATLTLGTANVLNLAKPDRLFYANQTPYSPHEYERKIDWLAERFRTLNADVLGVQEVWDEDALKNVVQASGLHYQTVIAPGAENTPMQMGASGTPRLGLVTRLKVEGIRSIEQFSDTAVVDVPDLGTYTRFERPPLHATLSTKHGQLLHVLVVHLKSKRPKFLQTPEGQALEDINDERIKARASLRSLVIRGAETVALRTVVIDLLKHTRDPLVVMGDFNDGPHSVTTQIVAATHEVAFQKAARDTALFNAYEHQGHLRLKKDVAFSHIHQGQPEVLDQIFVSEELVASSQYQLGDVLRVDYFNDHLQEGRDRSRSDHGFVRCVVRFKTHEASVTQRPRSSEHSHQMGT